MKRSSLLSTLIILALPVIVVLTPTSAWAGAAEEVAEQARKRGQAFSEGNAEAFVVDFADNAVFTSSRVAFRIEGKDAIRTYFVRLFQTYPQRSSAVRQLTSRAYANDTVVVTNSYNDQTWTDRAGQTTPAAVRISTTWVKVGGKWLTVDTHISRIPGP